MPQALEVLVILLLFEMGVGTPSQAQLHQPRSVYISSLVRLCTWMMDEEDPPEASLSPHFQLNTGVPDEADHISIFICFPSVSPVRVVCRY